jgi:hypothetical protein
MNSDTTIPFDPEVAQQALAAITAPPTDTEEVTIVENEPISVDQYRALLVLGSQDARTWANQIDALIAEIDSGKKVKGTKLNGVVRNSRADILRSSITDIKTAKVIG